MKRATILILVALGALATSVAVAQTVKMKDGKYHVTTPQGESMTVDQSGRIINHNTRTGASLGLNGDSKSLKLGEGSTKKESRTNAPPAKCEANRDLLVEHKRIAGEPVGVALIGSCDADVFNTLIDAEKHGIEATGSGELRLTESTVHGKEVALSLTGSGDAILEGVVLAGPMALHITGTGNVMAKNSKIYGKIVTTGTGKFVDEGGNKIVEDHSKAPSIKDAK